MLGVLALQSGKKNEIMGVKIGEEEVRPSNWQVPWSFRKQDIRSGSWSRRVRSAETPRPARAAGGQSWSRQEGGEAK